MKAEEQIRLTQHYAAQLAGVCDGAHAQDNQGYNGTDAQFGRILGTTDPEYWSAKMFNIAIRILPKYKRQLGEAAVTNLKSFKPLPEERGSVIMAERRKLEEELQIADDLPDFNEDLPLQWGRAKNCNTRRGRKSLRKAISTPEMRRLWRRHKEALKDRGISVTQDAMGDWVYCWWDTPVEDEITRFERKANEELPALEPLPAWIQERLRVYQVEGTKRVIRGIKHWGAVLDGSDTGTGKTYKAMAAVVAMGGTPVVVCPLAIVPGWHRAAKHFNTKAIVINYESLKTGKSELGDVDKSEGFAFTWTLDHVKNPVVIFDEVHKCKNPKAQNTAMLLAAESTGLPVIMLSATTAQDPLDMKAVGQVLHLFPKSNKGFWTWARQHGVANNGWGMKFMGSDEHLQNIHADIFGRGRGDRTRIIDIPNFPTCSFEAHLGDYGKATQEINKMAVELEDALQALKDRQCADKDPELVLTRILRARQRLEILKAPTWAGLAADEVTEGRSVILFCAFNETIDLLADALQTKCIIRGGQSAQEREANRLAFENNDEHIMIVNINAGGQSLDAHDLYGRPRTEYLPADFNGRMIQQAVGRVRRDGGKSHSICKFMYAAGTVEAQMADSCQEKLNRISIINDGNINDVIQVVARDH
jgi:superfamily II DNA or RNA helicase